METKISKLATLKQAHIRLSNAIIQATNELERAGAIQYFEFSYELAWKTLRQALLYLGKGEANSPRAVFRECANAGLIDNPEVWFEFLDNRNQTVHTYDQATADHIWHMLPSFEKELQVIIARLEALP